MKEILLNVMGRIVVAHLDSPERREVQKRLMWVLEKEVPDYTLVLFDSSGKPYISSLLDKDHHRGAGLNLSSH